jgi:hypothetical protein
MQLFKVGKDLEQKSRLFGHVSSQNGHDIGLEKNRKVRINLNISRNKQRLSINP